MRLDKLLEGVEIISQSAEPGLELDLVCCDSREARPGAAYAAARRVNGDGHQYIPAAVEAGALVIVAETPVEGAPYVQVADGAKALALMCANLNGRPADKMKIIGVTGTKGKTTTTYMLKTTLERAEGAKCGIIGTIGNFAGGELIAPAKNSTPEAPLLHSLLRQLYEHGCTHVIMEASSHALATDRVYGLPYAAAVFTNLSQDHLDYHITMDAYLRAKARLFDMAPVAAVNTDDPASELILATTGSKKLSFGIDKPADVRAVDIVHSAAGGAELRVVMGGESAALALSSPAKFMIYNALSAVTCAVALGVPFKDAVAALESFRAVPGRMERVDAGQPFRVVVDYAHSPESVKQMTAAARDYTSGRLISVFGCGGNRDRTKRPLMAKAAAAHSDYVIVTTDNPRFEEPITIIGDILQGLMDSPCPYEAIIDRREAIGRALDMAKPGDTVLIMGKGAEDYQEVRGVRRHFDDREVVREHLTR